MATERDDDIIDQVEFIGLGQESPVKIRLHKHKGEDQELLEKGSILINCLDPTVGYVNAANDEFVNGFGVGWENLPEEVDELIDDDMRDHLDKGGHLYLTVPAHAIVGEWTDRVVHKLKTEDPAAYFNGHIEEQSAEVKEMAEGGDTSDAGED